MTGFFPVDFRWSKINGVKLDLPSPGRLQDSMSARLFERLVASCNTPTAKRHVHNTRPTRWPTCFLERKEVRSVEQTHDVYKGRNQLPNGFGSSFLLGGLLPIIDTHA